MKKANDFFSSYTKKLINGINTCLIGQVERFDPVKMQMDVILLPDNDLVVNVPVATLQTSDFFIRLPYQPGDFVLVVFCQKDIDGIMYSGDATPSQRKLSLDDAVVVAGINLFDDPLPATNPDDLVISKKTGTQKIVLNATNDNIEVTCNQFLINGRVI